MKKLYPFLLSLLVLGAIETQAQTSISPSIYSIMYNEGNRLYSISWYDKNLTPSDSFWVYTFNSFDGSGNPKYTKFRTTPKEETGIYDFFIESDTVIFFAIEAWLNGTRSPSNIAKKPWINAPSNINLEKADHDSCNNTLTLKWNKYYDCIDTTALMYGISCNGSEVEKATDRNPYTISVNKLTPYLKNDTGVFQIDVYDTNSEFKGVSNTIMFVKPNSQASPTFIEATGTTVWEKPTFWTEDNLREMQNSNKISLSFTTDQTDVLNKFIIYRSDNENVGFDQLNPDGVEIFGMPTANYVDETADSTTTKRYFYKATVVNKCNEPLEALMSNVESNMVIKVTKAGDNSINTLQWSEYRKFRGELKEYNLYRVRAGMETKFIASTPGTLETDDLINLENKNVEELICYYVEAIEENNPNKIDGRSVSNLTCMTLSTLDQIEMPKYLTLSSDCKSASTNPFIFPGNVMTPDKYQMVIFDRWGSKVFETDDVTVGWDGTINGSTAPQGGYVYYIKFSGKSGVPAEKRGSFVLMCK